MGWKNIKILYEKVDGTFPHHEADPTKDANMADVKRSIESEKYDLGIGFDGDCDRMAPMTSDGRLILGDELLSLFSKQVIEKNPGASVVFDIKASQGLTETLHAIGAQPIMAPSGHSHIKDTLRKYKALLAGELSCHFFFADRYFGYDDGIYAMMRLFEIMVRSKKTLQELLADFPQKVSSPEFRLKCKEQDKAKIVRAVIEHMKKYKSVDLITIDGVRAQTSDGWGLVRASNTQPVISLRFESDTPEGLKKIKDMFVEVLKKYLGKEDIEKICA